MNTLSTRGEFFALLFSIDPDAKLNFSEEEKCDIMEYHEDCINALQEKMKDSDDKAIFEYAIENHRERLEKLKDGETNE